MDGAKGREGERERWMVGEVDLEINVLVGQKMDRLGDG